MDPKTDLPQGMLDMLILKVVALQPLHGYGIAQRLSQISDNVLQVKQGSLYPALHRLENRGWLSATWKTSENGREAKFYKLTKAGCKQLDLENQNWQRMIEVVRLVMDDAGQA
jgi:transcriptional regulator